MSRAAGAAGTQDGFHFINTDRAESRGGKTHLFKRKRPRCSHHVDADISFSYEPARKEISHTSKCCQRTEELQGLRVKLWVEFHPAAPRMIRGLRLKEAAAESLFTGILGEILSRGSPRIQTTIQSRIVNMWHKTHRITHRLSALKITLGKGGGI